MRIIQIAMNNLMRRKGRMLLLTLGLMVGVAAVVAVYSITSAMNMELQDRIDEYGANALILPLSEGVELAYGNTHVSEVTFELASLREEDLSLIRTIPDGVNINIISPKLIGAVEAEGRNALLVGMHPEMEFAMKPWFSIAKQEGLSSTERPTDLALYNLPQKSVLLGSGPARTLGKGVGDELTLNDEVFRVAAVLSESGSEEDGLIIVNLKEAQHILGRPGELSMVEINAYCRMCPIEEIVAQIGEVLPHTRPIALRQAALIREDTIDRFTSFGFTFSGIILVLGALAVFTTMMSSVKDRSREIGIFRALGFRQSHVVKIIFIEAACIGLFGGLAGSVLGTLAAQLAGPFLAQMQISVPWQGAVVLAATLFSILLALTGSLAPALHAAKLDPAEALRFDG